MACGVQFRTGRAKSCDLVRTVFLIINEIHANVCFPALWIFVVTQQLCAHVPRPSSVGLAPFSPGQHECRTWYSEEL